MKFLHPFPARMAPEILDDILARTNRGDVILDPMCGSGTVLAKALSQGRNAIGIDLDPLALLMAEALTAKTHANMVRADAQSLLYLATRRKVAPCQLPWVANCQETLDFIDYWFADEQAEDLAAMAAAIQSHAFANKQSKRLCQLALSRTIITKHAGASLAWDISHSRPHKKKADDENDFDVLDGFERALETVISIAGDFEPAGTGRVSRGDARNAHVVAKDVDHIITSPPYLNAIDYMRGHKFSLIWFGHTIPSLRNTRSANIGAERSGAELEGIDFKGLFNKLRRLRKLPQTQSGHLKRYAHDLSRMIASAAKCLKPSGTLSVVIGNSTLRGVYVENSEVFKWLALRQGFKFKREYTREIPSARRYLPENAETDLAKRMRHEVVQTYSLA